MTISESEIDLCLRMTIRLSRRRRVSVGWRYWDGQTAPVLSEDDKARIIEETLAPSAVISEVARRHGLSPQQLFTWRRQARRHPMDANPDPAPAFVPAIVDASTLERADSGRRRRRRGRPDHVCGIIEVEIDEVTVRIGRGADAKTVTAVLRAVKAGP
jgi:transposase